MKIRDYNEEYVKSRTIFGLSVKVIGIGLAVLLVLCGAGFVFRWLRTASDVVGPENVTKQWEFAYTYDRSLTAIANNWCTARTDELAETNTEVRPQLRAQRTAHEQNFNRVKAEYDAALANAFKAKLVKPPDVPTEAPTLKEKLLEVGCDAQ